MAFVGACAGSDVPTAAQPGITIVASIIEVGEEGEIFGNIFTNGVLTTDSGYTVTLEPRDDETTARLRYYNPSMWASPDFHDGLREFMFEWFDPRGSNTACGSIAQFLAGDTTVRAPEIHKPGPFSPPVGFETHCVLPGNYRLTLTAAGIVKEFDVDYVPTRQDVDVYNSETGLYDRVEDTDYDNLSGDWQDVIIHIETGTPPPGSDSAILYVQNAQSDPYGATFNAQSAPAGDTTDWFRFSASASTSSTTGLGRLLERLFWDHVEQPVLASGFFDATSNQSFLRLHRFTHADTTRYYQVGLETMRPSESPGAPSAFVPVFITVPAPAPDPLVNTITGPDMVTPVISTSYTWLQSPGGGVTPYTYGQWRYYLWPGPETVVGTGFKHKRTIAPTASPYIFRLRALVLDATPDTAQGTIFVEVMPAGGSAMAGTTTGVRLQNGSCGSRPPSGPARQAWLQWVFETHAGQVEPCAPELDQ